MTLAGQRLDTGQGDTCSLIPCTFCRVAKSLAWRSYWYSSCCLSRRGLATLNGPSGGFDFFSGASSALLCRPLKKKSTHPKHHKLGFHVALASRSIRLPSAHVHVYNAFPGLRTAIGAMARLMPWKLMEYLVFEAFVNLMAASVFDLSDRAARGADRPTWACIWRLGCLLGAQEFKASTQSGSGRH